MQGVVDLTNVEPLRALAFDVLGHHVERLLPDVVYLWFAALLLLDSTGRSRALGWVAMLLVAAAELGTLAALLFQVELPNLKVVVLLPFVWLLVESALSVGRSSARLSARSRSATGFVFLSGPGLQAGPTGSETLAA